MVNSKSFWEEERSSLVFQPASRPQLTSTTEYVDPDSSLILTIAGHLNGAACWKIYADSAGGKLVGIRMNDSIHLKPKQTTTYFVRAEGCCLPPGPCASITIHVNKVFWQTWWFIGFCSLAVFGLMLLIFILQFEKLKKREQEKTEMHRRIADMEMRALRLQMNPHFIFNAINSIQYFIVRNDQSEAYNYLAMFSKLMRNVLENSRHTFIPIKKELETLDLYIKLEMLRFDESFEKTITMDDKIDVLQTLIPPMLIQPYLENAIWHGLLLKEKGPKKIMIVFKKYADFILCTIEDTGVGRTHSQKYKSKHTTEKSLGMRITKERLNLLTQTNTRSFNVEIIDLTDEHGNASGTRVELTIPIMEL